ncbi:hypothetical protein JCM19037_1616 [Geomicrobium sp. JCM 19037]|uniref:hypothetical protein n=1 Tax=Geomicrobium sp. JCM 19037 TaxID=1460634 RepID=UPI00045F4733|nr:hypothetical protein [Geomicrobium sp. JCM 19037]GAK03302.1 hypothetical protein JCM19037_1616 [Geomicrobium sp. JCM 19037]
MVKITMENGNVIEGTIGEIVELQTQLAQKETTEPAATSGAKAGDVVEMTTGDHERDYNKGDRYTVRENERGAYIVDDEGDKRFIDRHDHLAYKIVSRAPQPPQQDDTLTYEGDTYRKVERKAAEGDYVVFTDESELESYLTGEKPYEVTEVDSLGDPQVIDDDDDELDTCGYKIEVYEKVGVTKADEPTLKVGDYAEVTQDGHGNKGKIVEITEVRTFRSYPYKTKAVGEDDGDIHKASQLRKIPTTTHEGVVYREFERHAEKGELIKVTNASITGGYYGNGDVFTVVNKNSNGVFSSEFSIGLLHSEYVVLEPLVEPATTQSFKAGDKVKLLSGGGEWPLVGKSTGNVYVIKALPGDANYGGGSHRNERRIDINGAYALPEQLELVSDEQTLEVGDTVEIIHGGGERYLRGFTDGEHVKIAKEADDEGDYKVQRSSSAMGYAQADQLRKVEGTPRLLTQETARALKFGDTVECVKERAYVSVGKTYAVTGHDGCGDPIIIDDDGDEYVIYGNKLPHFKKAATTQLKTVTLRHKDGSTTTHADVLEAEVV